VKEEGIELIKIIEEGSPFAIAFPLCDSLLSIALVIILPIPTGRGDLGNAGLTSF